MTLWMQTLLATVGIVTGLAALGALAMYLLDRATVHRTTLPRKHFTATDPYAQAQALAARQLARRHPQEHGLYAALGPGR